ncbi:OmpW/AlkL family protein [Psychrobacter phenylpyruvicus]|uniref:Outer membrane protein W n=1 Tax=Psychrobacter phenylpyruvicus TaxID=29432 RepID=A0A379LK75_9GAMM|nr:OmpW family outer membrane protein [Psychrobacter phenylpyruvicus]SUD90174.1 Outer membrane protein W precursor [Psychrobacter phenylpyruvicus]
MIKRQALLIAALAAGLSMTAMAETAGTWTVGVGAGYVDPDSDNGTLAEGLFKTEVDYDVRPTITAEYFVADNVGIELLAALPFHHDIDLKDAAGNVTKAKTQLLPPTLSLQYHFDNVHANVKPFIGVGANYTTFFKERIYDGKDSKLEIEDNWGVAGHVGLDFKLNPTDAVRIDARYIDLEPDVKLNGNDIGTAEINPWVYGISYVKRF